MVKRQRRDRSGEDDYQPRNGIPLSALLNIRVFSRRRGATGPHKMPLPTNAKNRGTGAAGDPRKSSRPLRFNEGEHQLQGDQLYPNAHHAKYYRGVGHFRTMALS